MGCDIYLHVERRTESGYWEHVPGDFYDGRRYVLFGLLAGVRNHEELTPIVPPRGLPEPRTQQNPDAPGEISQEVYNARYAEADGPDRRVTSWLTVEELLRFDWNRFSRKYEETDFSVIAMSKLRLLAQQYNGASNVRIVFWFDDEFPQAAQSA